MDEWRNNFQWQMGFYAVLLLLMAVGAAEEVWLFRAKFLADPLRMLMPAAAMVFVVFVCLAAAGLCVRFIVSTRRHAAKMKALEEKRKNNPGPLSMEPMSLEKKEEFRQTMTRSLGSLSPRLRAQLRGDMEKAIQEAADKVRAEHGSSPKVEASIAETEELWRQVFADVDAGVGKPERPARVLDADPVHQFLIRAAGLDGLQTWAEARAAQRDGLGRVLAGGLELAGRVSAVTPGERARRLMPALCSFLTLFALGLALGALDRGRHTHEAVALGVCTLGLWAFCFRDWRRLDGAVLTFPWWMEWSVGVSLTGVTGALLEYVASPTRPHAPAHHWPAAHFLVIAVFGLCLATLAAWWVRVLWDLVRPALGRTREDVSSPGAEES